MTPVCVLTWLGHLPPNDGTAAARLHNVRAKALILLNMSQPACGSADATRKALFLRTCVGRDEDAPPPRRDDWVREEPPCAFGVPCHACAVRSDAARSGGGGRGPATRARLYHCRGIEADHGVQGPEGRRTFLYWFAQSETSRLVRSAVASATHRGCPPCKAAPLPHATT